MKASSSTKTRRLCVGDSNCSTKGLCGCIFKGLSSCPNNTSTTTRKASLVDFADDVLLNIFLRLPVNRAKCVSTRWRSLISAAYFTRSFILTRLSGDIKDHHHATMGILFHLRPYTQTAGQVCILPLPHDDLNKVSSSSLPCVASTFDFIPPLKPVPIPDYYDSDDDVQVTERLLVDVSLIGTYGGLVLLQGKFQDWDDFNLGHLHTKIYYYYYYYYVCNPVTKQWVELPWIPTLNMSSRTGFTCYYTQEEDRIWADDIASYENIIKHNTSFDPNKIEFTVVSIYWRDSVFEIHVFSASDDITAWRIFHIPFPPGFTRMRTPQIHKVLFSNRKFHWCGDNCIVVYDPFNTPRECDTIPMPPIDSLGNKDTYIMHLEACEGCLRLVSSFIKTGRLSVWELSDYANKVWVKTIDVNCESLIFQSFVGGADKDKVYMLDYPSTIMLLDVRNASLQHVYTYSNTMEPYRALQSVESFFSGPWPASVPMM